MGARRNAPPKNATRNRDTVSASGKNELDTGGGPMKFSLITFGSVLANLGVFKNTILQIQRSQGDEVERDLGGTYLGSGDYDSASRSILETVGHPLSRYPSHARRNQLCHPYPGGIAPPLGTPRESGPRFWLHLAKH